MDSFVKHYLDNNGSKSNSTATAFKTSINRLIKFLKLPFDEWNKNTFNNDKTIVDNLITDYSLNTIIQTILLILRFLEYKKADDKIINKYRNYLNDFIQERNQNAKKQNQTHSEKLNWINYPELKNKVEDNIPDYLNKKKAYSDFRNFLILALFSLQPPVRIGNYLNMKYKGEGKRGIQSLNKKFNYITKMENGKYKMIFNNYKTSKYIGKITHIIDNDNLNELINKWFSDYNKNKDFFITNVSGKPITQTNFTNAQKSISKKILQKELSTNDFRHIYLTHFLSTNPSIQQKEKVAQLIGQKYKPSRMELYERRNEQGENVSTDNNSLNNE